MSRVLTSTVPTEFLPLDTRVTDDDSFANVRDLQVARQNHNILLAKRIKRTIATAVFNDLHAPFYGIDMDNTNPRLIWQQTLAVNQMTRELHLYLRASCTEMDAASAVSDSVKLYPVIVPYGRAARYSPYVEIEVTTAFAASESSAGDYAKDVPMPVTDGMTYWHGRQLVDFCIFMFGRLDAGRSEASGVTITDYSQSWIDLSGSTASVGNSIQVGLQHRVVVAASGARHFIDRPFSSAFDPSTATATIRETMGVKLWSMSLYEVVDTDIMGTPGEL